MSERIDGANRRPEHRIPTRFLLEYLAAGGLDTRLALLIEGQRYRGPDPEQLWSLAIEVEQLFLQTELPERTELELLELLDRARERGRERLLVPLPAAHSEAHSEERGALEPLRVGRYEPASLGPHAEAVRAVRIAWARIWCEVVTRRSDKSSALSMPSRAELACFEPELVSAAAPGEAAANPTAGDRPAEVTADLRYAEAPGSAPVALTAEALEPLVGRLEQGACEEASAWAPILTRYALGLRYNRLIAPADPFEFLGTIASADAEADHLTEAYLAAAEAAADHDGTRLLRLARRAYAVERKLPGSVRRTEAARAEAPPRTTARAAQGPLLSAQQLVGIAAAPGRGRGVVARVAANGAGAEGLPAGAGVVAAQSGPAAAAREGVVLVCERLTGPILQAAFASGAAVTAGVVAVVEHGGAQLGLGALLAREHGLPCVSGVGDLEFIDDHTPVAVDGDLGLVTVEPGAR